MLTDDDVVHVGTDLDDDTRSLVPAEDRKPSAGIDAVAAW